MNIYRTLSGTMLLAAWLGHASPALAQSDPGAPSPAAPSEGAPPPAAGPPAEHTKDGVRLRGGFSVNGGVFLLPANPVGGAVSIAGRVGVQFNHYLGLYYQNTPIIGATVAHDTRSGTVVAADYNSILLDLTLFHMLELAAGPSLDYVALAKGSITVAGVDSSVAASSGTGIAAGGHGRAAFIIGGLSGGGPRRSGFVIGVDAHPMFLSTGMALSLTVGLGAEWY